MYVRRLALPVTAVHSSCCVCGTSIVCIAFGYSSEDEIQLIRSITPICPKCDVVEHFMLWRDEADWIESVNHATRS